MSYIIFYQQLLKGIISYCCVYGAKLLYHADSLYQQLHILKCLHKLELKK